MRYFGGKHRIGKQIANIINSIEAKTYHEPFCGVYSVGRYVKLPYRSGADIHPDLILLLQAVQNDWVGPTEVSEELYNQLKNKEPSVLRGFVGFGCSFGGKFFGGYAKDNTKRNYAYNASSSLVKLAESIKDVDFYQQDYSDYSGDADIIYCDPPYKDTTNFSSGKFNSDQFWDWARNLSGVVLVSEYEAPSDFEAIWKKPVKTDMNSKTGQKINRIEKLFARS